MKTIDLHAISKSSYANKHELLLDWPCAAEDKLFFNGYQTWTTSRELAPTDRMRGANSMPRPVVNHWGIDRYGDYHFINYDNKPGHMHGFSYCYRRIGDEYSLIASTDETNGYTIFYYDSQLACLRIVKDSTDPNAELQLFAASGSEDEVFDAWFEAMGITPKQAPPLAGYSSWYNRYENISEQTISDDLLGCSKVVDGIGSGTWGRFFRGTWGRFFRTTFAKSGTKEPTPCTTKEPTPCTIEGTIPPCTAPLFQIDDGWQVTVGEWSENSKFPNGMKACADAIHDKEMLAGLWLAPFVATKKSFIYREHPDWLLTHDGEPWYCGCNWGGFYSLDIDNPEVCEYLRVTFDKVLNKWGFDLVKLDFLYAVAPWHQGDESRGARMCRAMQLLREWCGDKLILGCGVPLWPAFGLVDYCRISCDVGLDWRNNWIMRHSNNECVSTVNAITNSYYRRQLNGRAFLSDPDVFFLRRDNIKLSEDEKLMLARVNAQYGGIFLTSDNMGDYDAQQIKTYQELLSIWRDKTWTDLDFLKALN